MYVSNNSEGINIAQLTEDSSILNLLIQSIDCNCIHFKYLQIWARPGTSLNVLHVQGLSQKYP